MKMLKTVDWFESLPTLPVSPKEVLFYSYPNKVVCSNPFCINSIFKSSRQVNLDQEKPAWLEGFTDWITQSPKA